MEGGKEDQTGRRIGQRGGWDVREVQISGRCLSHGGAIAKRAQNSVTTG